MKVLINNQEVEVNVLSKTESKISIELNGRVFNFDKSELSLNSTSFDKEGMKQIFDGDLEAYLKILPKAKSASDVSLSEGSLVSPMPGKIFKILKNKGDKVSKGEVILIMEAMKMEHSISASSDGVVQEIFYGEGDQVDGGSVLCEVSE